MQGNRKCTDGFSDSSSIGSVLDDADREVSSLTDRAFRSLCISEDASFHDSDLALSPDLSHRGFGPLHQGTVSHSHRKSGIWSQLPSQGTEHTGWAATFQQRPKYVQGEDKYPKSSPPLTPAQWRLEVPVSGLRSSNKPVSKVSSLIKSFDRTENQRCDGRPPPSKPPALQNPPKFAPLPDSSVNFCFDSAFLTVRRVPAEVSNAHQGSHQPTQSHREPESPKNPEMAHHGSRSFLSKPDSAVSSFESKFPSPPHQPAKVEPSKGQGWAHKGTFLHSENSAFESWDAHQPKLLERRNVAESVSENTVPKHYEDTSPVKETHTPQHKVSPCPVRPSCAQEENGSVTGVLSTSGPWGTRDLGAQVFHMEGKPPSSQPDPQVKSTQPPWRKPKTSRGRKGNVADVAEEQKQTHGRGATLYAKHNVQAQLAENDTMDVAGDCDSGYSPPFNISKLLTPIIPTKHALESSDCRPETSHSPPGQLNGYQEQEPSECPSRESYKSKAPSLLFNLKDVRKRVKSTYSPSPLSKGVDEKSQGKADGKQEPVSNGIVLPNGIEESPPNELSAERTAEDPTTLHTGTQDPTAHPGEASVHNLGSPPTAAMTSFFVNGKAAERSSEAKDAVDRESEPGSSGSTWHPDSRGRGPRKHLSLKLCTRESEAEAGQAAEQTKPPQLENGLLRSISQETEPEHETGHPNPPLDQKVSPGPLSPEEEDVFYSDSQSDFMPGLWRKAKFSTSSSDQSFASFDDQQKMWFSESQREDRKNDMSAGDSEKEKEQVTGTDNILSNRHTCVGEHSQGKAPQTTGGLCADRPGRAPSEETKLRGSQMGETRDTALSQARDPTPCPSSAANKHLLFMIKDNTLRATPVIKPVILPLLRTLSSEDSLRGGHREGESPKQGWSEDAGGRSVPESQEMPSTRTPANTQGTRSKHIAFEVPEDPVQMSMAAGMDTSWPDPEGTFSSPPLVEEGNRMKLPPDRAQEVMANDGRNRPMDSRKPAAPRHIPIIAFPEGDLEEQPTRQTLATCWEEQPQTIQGRFLSAPRAGPLGQRLVLGQMATSPNPSSLGESSACSPSATSLWDNTSQAPTDLGLLPEEPPSSASLGAGPGPTRLARREDLMHGLMWEPDSSDAQNQPATEDLRALSPRGSLLDVATGLERPEPPTQLERVAEKPPAVPPKTEKALRRAKKLASKRRKSEQIPERLSEAHEVRKGTGRRPWAFGEGPQLPTVRALPPPAHRHSVSGIMEPMGRRPWEAQPLAPLPPYPATQKVLQDPQSGEYFVFDLTLQVKIKTFYDPETGKYIKVSVPASEGASPEPPGQDALAMPYLVYPGLRPVPITALRPLRCSSQLSAPTFLGKGLHSRPHSVQDTGLWPGTGPQGDISPPKATQHAQGPPRGPEDEEAEAPGLNIISTDDLEDFATEGIS
ncbi:cardiac-enriched FHL2-interacting protein [Erethizon dorsatum]